MPTAVDIEGSAHESVHNEKDTSDSSARGNVQNSENGKRSNVKVITDYCDSKVTLTDILNHRVTDECLSIFNTNGTMVKTQKSKLLQSFTFSPLNPVVEDLFPCP